MFKPSHPNIINIYGIKTIFIILSKQKNCSLVHGLLYTFTQLSKTDHTSQRLTSAPQNRVLSNFRKPDWKTFTFADMRTILTIVQPRICLRQTQFHAPFGNRYIDSWKFKHSYFSRSLKNIFFHPNARKKLCFLMCERGALQIIANPMLCDNCI
jgi:hypothetical protein